MIRLVFLAAALSLSLLSTAQNLVPNPSFEEMESCPDDPGQVWRCTDWNPWRGTSDYFSSCAGEGNFVDVPTSGFGYQIPSSGESYIGIWTFPSEGSIGVDYRELVGCELLAPLSIGTDYFVSMRVSVALGGWGLNCTYASNNLGVMFTTQGYDENEDAYPELDNFAHLSYEGIISDSLLWTEIAGSFTADSSYSHLGFGNFFDDSSTLYLNTAIPPDEGGLGAYYFVDDICVKSASPCRADLNEDLLVNVYDLLLLLPNLGCEGDCLGNFNCDDIVNTQDLLFFLSAFAAQC
jgi:hypothetical protein